MHVGDPNGDGLACVDVSDLDFEGVFGVGAGIASVADCLVFLFIFLELFFCVFFGLYDAFDGPVSEGDL